MAENETQQSNPNYVSGNVYKIFIFESNTAKLLKTESYVDFPDVQKEILEYNKDHQDDRWNLFIGTEFPPKGVKFDDTIKQFVDKTLTEKVADGEIIIPPDMKIVNEVFVRLNKKELLEKGLIKIEYDEKIDEFDHIVKLTKKEMYEQGKTTKFQVYDFFIQELNLAIESKLKNFYNYPMQEMGTWLTKKTVSLKWSELTIEEKKDILTTNNNIYFYDLLIAESNIESVTDINEKINKIDFLADKIINKYSELERTYGKMFQLRSSVKEQFKKVLDTDGINHYDEMDKIYKSLEL